MLGLRVLEIAAKRTKLDRVQMNFETHSYGVTNETRLRIKETTGDRMLRCLCYSLES